MPNKIDTTINLRDRADQRKDSAQSNAQYVRELNESNSLKPPKQLFKEDPDYIKGSKTSPSKSEKKKKAKSDDEQVVIKDKLKENKGRKQKKEDVLSKDKANTIPTTKLNTNLTIIDGMFTKSNNDDLGSEAKLLDLQERYEIAQVKYLEIKDKLEDAKKPEIERKMDQMRAEIVDLKHKISFPALAAPIFNLEEELPGEGDGDGILGTIKDKISEITDFGLPILPGKKKEEEEEEEENDKELS